MNRSLLSRDVVAGVTLAALAIPEVMGYTKIAGTPVITGLYTILLPAVAFALFGSSRHLVVGGDSASAAILYAGIAGLGVSGLQPGTNQWLAYASLAALITGGLLLLARIARLGFLADFISRTVLVGFLTGVGIQVALGQFAGMLGVPVAEVDVNQVSGTVIKFWDTLKEIPDTSLTTLAVSLWVIVTLVVFEKWIKAIPGGLVAVVGAIAISWVFDLQAHGVSCSARCQRLPVVRAAERRGLERRRPAARDMRIDVPRHPRPERGDVAGLRRQVQGQFVENNDLVGLSLANLAAGLSSTFVVNGSPTKTEMADEAKSKTQVAMLTMAADGRDRPALPDETPPVPAERGALRRRVRHRREAGRPPPHAGECAAAPRRVRDRGRDRRWSSSCVGVEQGILLAIVLSLLDHVRRHYSPHDSVVVATTRARTSASRPRRARSPSPGSSSTASASGSSTRTRRASPRR